jgi:hypothetical protein
VRARSSPRAGPHTPTQAVDVEDTSAVWRWGAAMRRRPRRGHATGQGGNVSGANGEGKCLTI